MTTETENKIISNEAVAETTAPVASAENVASATPAAPVAAAPAGDRRTPRDTRDFKKNTRRPARRESRVKPEFDQKIISIRRVARVVTGGRRFSFSVALVAGNRKGMVGVGLGKAGDTSLAIEKAFSDARKSMVQAHLTKEMSIAHEVNAKFSSSRVTLMPAKDRGVVAGSAVRIVLEMAGVKDVGGKVRSGSKNKLNIARATIAALEMVSKPREKVAAPAAAVNGAMAS